MKHKVSELEGDRLDIAVALAEGRTVGQGLWLRTEAGRLVPYTDFDRYDRWWPSKQWQHGGPIIERERIDCTPKDGPGSFMGEKVDGPRWLANCPGKWCETGPTLLIAAMRAYVASKLGEEVELP